MGAKMTLLEKGMMGTSLLGTVLGAGANIYGTYMQVKEGRAARRLNEKWNRTNFAESQRQFGIESGFKDKELKQRDYQFGIESGFKKTQLAQQDRQLDFQQEESSSARAERFMANLAAGLAEKPKALQAFSQLCFQYFLRQFKDVFRNHWFKPFKVWRRLRGEGDGFFMGFSFPL
jgi:hypothetical protein